MASLPQLTVGAGQLLRASLGASTVLGKGRQTHHCLESWNLNFRGDGSCLGREGSLSAAGVPVVPSSSAPHPCLKANSIRSTCPAQGAAQPGQALPRQPWSCASHTPLHQLKRPPSRQAGLEDALLVGKGRPLSSPHVMFGGDQFTACSAFTQRQSRAPGTVLGQGSRGRPEGLTTAGSTETMRQGSRARVV